MAKKNRPGTAAAVLRRGQLFSPYNFRTEFVFLPGEPPRATLGNSECVFACGELGVSFYCTVFSVVDSAVSRVWKRYEFSRVKHVQPLQVPDRNDSCLWLHCGTCL